MEEDADVWPFDLFKRKKGGEVMEIPFSRILIKETAGYPDVGYPRGTLVLNIAENRLYCKREDYASDDDIPDAVYYKLNEAAGTSVADSSGNARTATATFASWIAGKYGNAYDFAPLATYKIDTPFTTDFAFNSDFTLEFYNNHAGQPSDPGMMGSHNAAGTICTWDIAYSNPNWYFRIGSSVTGAPGATHQQIAIPGMAAAWHHLAIVGDRTNNLIYYYFDGVLQSTTAWQFFPAAASMKIRFGACNDPDFQYEGALDEIKIWKRMRTGSEILSDMEESPAVSGWSYIDLTTLT